MKIFYDNVNFESRSGPNGFALKLARALGNRGHAPALANESPNVQLSFIQSTCVVAPVVQRLDGVWFNAAQDWRSMNSEIKRTYDSAVSVIVQSSFDSALANRYLGTREHTIVRNGTDIDAIMAIDPIQIAQLSTFERIWLCASAWRPHKRLNENIRYFLEHASTNECLIIAGKDAAISIADPRVFYAGDLETQLLHSIMRISDVFIHLAYLDHCPNVVVDARAAGCHIICSSTGGTEEIAGLDSTVVIEDEWDMNPCMLYQPPQLDFSRTRAGQYDTDISMSTCAAEYERILNSAAK